MRIALTKMILSFLVLAISSFANANLVERIAVIVNDEVITMTEIEAYRARLKSNRLVDDLFVTDPDALVKDESKLVDIILKEKLVDSEVKQQSLAPTVERVEQEISSICKKNGISRAQLKQALKEQGVVFSEYQDFLRTRLGRQALIEKAITSKIKISDDEVATHYINTKKASGHEVYEYTLAHILFRPKSGDVDGAEKRAQGVLTKLGTGTPFETLASQYSEDPNFNTGGLLGTFKSGEFLKELEAAAKSLAVNQTSTLIRSKLGFHIVKLLNKKLVSDPAFEKEKELIRGRLYEQAFKKQFAFWLDQKRQEAFIRINQE